MKLTKQRVGLCFDLLESPSVNDVKPRSRGKEILKNITQFVPRQSILREFSERLKISSFARQLLSFLYEEYKNPVYGTILGKKLFYCTVDNEFKKFYSEDGALTFQEICNLYGCHLKGDTCLMFHTKHADSIGLGNIALRGVDTDIAIILS